MSEVTVRICEPPDIPAILALERRSLGAPQWGETFWSGRLLEDVTHKVFVAEIDGNVCGYIVVAIAVDIAELQNIAVDDSARRRGLGRALCERAMEWAREQGAKSIELEVRDSNVAALSLYREIGFEMQGKRKKYYKDPEEDAVLMSAKLCE